MTLGEVKTLNEVSLNIVSMTMSEEKIVKSVDVLTIRHDEPGES